jgi:DNA modification methylase
MIKTLKIGLIEPNTGQIEGLPKNPRIIKDEKWDKLKQSIIDDPEMLNLREILVFPHDGKFVIIGGNMRFRVCKELGYSELPCKIIPEETPVEKLKAYTIKDNAAFGDWNWDELANEWDVLDLQNWGIDLPDFDVKDEESEEGEEDDFNVEEAIKPEPITQPGDVWKLGRHRLICGDVRDVNAIDKLMDSKLADLVVTDPPYNVDYVGKTEDALKIENDKMSDSQFLEFLIASFDNINNHMKKGAAFYIWHADSEGANFRNACVNVGWKVRQCLVWNKNTMVLGRQDYQWKHEPCLYGWKDGAAHYFIDDRCNTTVIEDKLDIDKLSKAELKTKLKEILEGTISTTIMNEDKPSRSAEHPTMKPVKLIARQLRNSSKRGQIVLDTFGGSGTTLITAEQLGRICYMSENDPVYCDVIVARWEKYTGQTATLERLLTNPSNSE